MDKRARRESGSQAAAPKRRTGSKEESLPNQPEPKRLRSSDNSIPGSQNYKSCKDVISHLATLPLLPLRPPKLVKPTREELKELERRLGFDSKSDKWRDDWAGNLAFADDNIQNPVSKGKKNESFRQPLLLWAEHSDYSMKLLLCLIRFVYSMDTTPPEAKRILSSTVSAETVSVKEIEAAIRRTCYDPVVLEEDGWTTVKSSEKTGPVGGPSLIGDMIRWQNSDAVVIAFVHDDDIGDMWKAIWVEDLLTFDLEAEEMLDARKKWERRNKPRTQAVAVSDSVKQSRANGNSDFRVAGIDEGIVLASSPFSRPGVFWPARVMNTLESSEGANQTKRSISKYKLSLVFLAPYWDLSAERGRKMALSERSDPHPGELFQVETVEANAETVKTYSFDPADGVDLSKLELAFRFTGLPKGTFRRFVDSHRIALSLKLYARMHLKRKTSAAEKASFGLFDTHPMSVLSPAFPSIVLHLPFNFILSQLPVFKREQAQLGKVEIEPVLNLSSIVENMKPPRCWKEVDQGQDDTPQDGFSRTIRSDSRGSSSALQSPSSKAFESKDFGTIMKALPKLNLFFSNHSENPIVASFLSSVLNAFASSSQETEEAAESESSERKGMQTTSLQSWAFMKAHGEDLIVANLGQEGAATVSEWRQLSERLFALLVENKDGTLNKTLVISDSRCNLHVTAGLNMERSVRLPAALKGAQLASETNIRFERSDEWKDAAEYVESSLLPKVHDASFLKRMKGRCAAAKNDTEVLMLTEDSEGNGGEDTRGCRGSWEAALAAVAASVSAVDKVVAGDAPNAFCATRPPGHHAGKKLHAMKAISNGFCILNPVASAAVHAVTSVAEGGLGLRRVCVLDFDVHHGNGTQDILCSTFDPRFLYVSLHAGGVQPSENHEEDDDDGGDDGEKPKKDGADIFPGRCGNSSPHKGVVNIPLGSKVTSHAVGNALLTKVTPAVDDFSPDLILLSAGFDAHKNDPMGLGALTAEDFGHITEVACQLAFKSCSGRVVSVLEGGYGVPCCRAQTGATSSVPETQTAFCQPTSDPETKNGNSDRNGMASAESSTGVMSENATASDSTDDNAKNSAPEAPRPQPTRLADLGDFLPNTMDDQVPLGLQRKLEKCHDEGFVQCVQAHVSALARCGSSD